MRPHYDWQLSAQVLPLGERTRIMGIVNVTPDSFSDGGRYNDPQSAIEHALRLLDEGADLLDVGGESTRPGSPAGTLEAVRAEDEQRRVLPVLRGILQARPGTLLSVDTYRASTARRAVEAGAQIVNDVSGLLWDRDMVRTVAELGCAVVLMHTRGLPSEWQHLPPLADEDVLPTVLAGLRHATDQAERAGIPRSRIVLDPGFGFGKLGAQNLALLDRFGQLQQLGLPLLAGLSRKGFLAPELPPAQRDAATHAAHARAIQSGAHLIRVHDVRGARAAADRADVVL